MKLTVLLVMLTYSYIGYSQVSAEEKIHEVFDADYFAENVDLYNFWINLLENRVSFVEETTFPEEKYVKISEVELTNSSVSIIPPFNPEMFALESFNPLHYQLDFYESKLTMVYRIDESDYLLVIQPQ